MKKSANNEFDDKFYIGTEGGLYAFNRGTADANNGGTTPASSHINPPVITATKVVSIKRFDATHLLVTYFEEGVYLLDISGAIPTWVSPGVGLNPLMHSITSKLSATNSGGTTIVVNKFTQLHQLIDPLSGNVNGYLLFNENQESGIYYTGIYYSPTVSTTNFLPSGDWIGLSAIDAGLNHWGWDLAKPSANINSSFAVNDNNALNWLIVGKNGNLFATQAAVSSDLVDWQQIYTNEILNGCNNKYNNIGFVNTVDRDIFPDADPAYNFIWHGQFDRQLWYSDINGMNNEIIRTTSSCVNITPNTSPQQCGVNYGPGIFNFTDCAFITKDPYDNTGNNPRYASVAEGPGGSKGRAMVIKLTLPTAASWNIFGNVNCFDPIKMLFAPGSSGSDKYLLATDNSTNKDRLYYYDNSSNIWQMLTLPFYTANQNIVDLVFDPTCQSLFVIRKDNIVYKFNRQSPTSFTVACTTTTNASVQNKNLALIRYGQNNDYKIICGTFPTTSNPVINPTINNLYTVYDSQTGCSVNATGNDAYLNTPCGVTNPPLIFHSLMSDDITENIDAGVTAIEVNQNENCIYAATVSYDYLNNNNMKSHLYRGVFDAVNGDIDLRWLEVSGDINTTGLPNKTIQRIISKESTFAAEKVYSCVRGLGEWKDEIDVFRVEVTKIDVSCIASDDGSATATVYGGVGTFTYSWNSVPVQNAPTATALTAGIYNVVVTDASTGCTISQSVIVGTENSECCGSPLNTPITNQTGFDNAVVNIGNYNLNPQSGGALNYIFSSSATINASNFSIAAGVTITIPNGVTVDIINGSTFESCGNMWGGFIVEAGGTLTITGSAAGDILIRDAQYGTLVNPTGNLNCNHANFEHDYVGIFIPDDLDGGSVTINGTTFACTNCTTGDPLKNAYTGQTPMPNTITFAGVEAYNSIFNIGGGGDVNHFKDIYRGAFLNNCTNSIMGSDFKNILFDWYYLTPGGNGIYSDMTTKGALRQFGFGDDPANNVSFDNCQTAIYSTHGSVGIYSNRMTNVSSGIVTSNVKAQNITINGNRIDAASRGMALSANDYAAIIKIESNHVTVNGASAKGIGIYEFNNSPNTRYFNLSCNNVTVTNGTDGIYINAANQVAAQFNYVALNSTTTYSNGFKLQGSKNCTLIENTVIGVGTNRHTAFLLSLSPTNTLVNNHSDATQYGFEFWNACQTDENFKGNTMGNHNIGLHVNGSGIMGTQTHRGNKWPGTYGAWGAQNQNINPSEITNNPIIVQDPNSGMLYHPTNNTTGGALWIKYISSPTWFSTTYGNICVANIVAPDGENDEARLSFTDTLIVLNSITALEFQPELKQITKRDVQDKLNDNDSLKTGNVLFENFYIANDNTAIGLLSSIQLLVKNTNADYAAIALGDSIIQIKSDSLILLDSMLHVNTTTNLINLKQQLLSDLQLLIVQQHVLLATFKLNNALAYCTALSLNDIVVSTNYIEQYEKEINDFRFTYFDSVLSSIPSSRLETVQYVASLCPFAYGKAVYIARSELARLGLDTIQYDDKANCTTLGYYRQIQNHNVNDKKEVCNVIAYPNPVKDVVYLQFIKNGFGNATIVIRDVIGKVVLLQEQD